jgi:hypothetical protein
MRKLRALIAIGGASAGLAACTDQPTSAPIVHRLAGVNPVVANLGAACDFTALKAAVRDYVAAGNDVIYDYIRNMSSDAYGQGMNGLARLAQVRSSLDPVLKKSGATPAQGAAAVIQFLACMPIGDAVQENFTTNIVSAFGAGGMFEVPTTSSTDPVFSRGEAAGTKYWAAKPAGGASWGSLTSTVLTSQVRYLVFGYEINSETGFDYNVVPMLGNAGMPTEFAGDLIIGACGSFGSAVRVLHVADVLFDQSMSFCQPDSPPLALRSSGFGSDLAMLVRRSLSVFAPQTGYAFGGGVGGAVSELSPSSLLSVTPTITYTPQPAKTPSVGDPLGVMVSVFTGTQALKNAVVTLTITGNSGRDALFFDPTKPTQRCYFVTRTTNELGVADFSAVELLKPGGYSLTAAAVFDPARPLTATPVVSNPVNVKNKKVNGIPTATCS